MAEVFQYINAMYCIRDEQFNPIHDPKVITTNNITDIHKQVLSKGYDDGNTNALVFQNELFFTRPIADVNNNEVKRFLMTNSTWDVLIMNENEDLSTTPVPTYTHIHLVNRNDFIIDKVYLVSRRFMQKVKNNTLTNIETYYYDTTFVDSADGPPSSTRRVVVGKINNIRILVNDQIRYVWDNFSLN